MLKNRTMTEHQKLVLAHARLLEEFQGTLKAVTHWDVPDELKERMYDKIKELEKIEIKMPKE